MEFKAEEPTQARRKRSRSLKGDLMELWGYLVSGALMGAMIAIPFAFKTFLEVTGGQTSLAWVYGATAGISFLGTPTMLFLMMRGR